MSIRDQNYVRYEGPIVERSAWWIIARMTLRLMWSFTRTRLMMLLLWVVPVIMAVLVLVEYGVRSQMGAVTGSEAPGVGAILFFMQVQVFSVAMLYMASACGVIADDMRHRTFQLYFSKPVARWEYALGKWLGVYMLGALVGVFPAVLVGGLRAAFYARGEHGWAVLGQVSGAVGLSAVITAILALMVVGLSTITARTGYVVLSWLGILIVPLIMHGIFAIATDGSELAHLWSLPGNTLLLGDMVIGESAREVPGWAPFAVWLALAGASLGLVWRRVSRLEGVA